MIARLTGVLAEKSAGRVIVDVRGVGYEVHIPFSTYYELGSESDPVTLQIYTHAKGDQLSLYGFSTAREKELFTRLIQVSGIGPRLGIAILSGMPVDEFLEAVADRDTARLCAAPGVGKKTAGRIVLEMRDRLAIWRGWRRQWRRSLFRGFRLNSGRTWFPPWSTWAMPGKSRRGPSPRWSRRRVPIASKTSSRARCARSPGRRRMEPDLKQCRHLPAETESRRN